MSVQSEPSFLFEPRGVATLKHKIYNLQLCSVPESFYLIADCFVRHVCMNRSKDLENDASNIPKITGQTITKLINYIVYFLFRHEYRIQDAES